MHLEGVPQPKDRPVKLSAYHWKKLRQELFAKVNGRCQGCGRIFEVLGDMHAHHKMKRSEHRLDEISNLRALCFKCHELEHGRRW